MSQKREQTRLKAEAGKLVLEDLRRLAGLLKTETDRRSRQVILSETARMLAELEEQLKAKAS
jgi:gamma-glutamylcysteine synthetase